MTINPTPREQAGIDRALKFMGTSIIVGVFVDYDEFVTGLKCLREDGSRFNIMVDDNPSTDSYMTFKEAKQ